MYTLGLYKMKVYLKKTRKIILETEHGVNSANY